jgi:dephospho-CoA kinase
MMVLGVTGGIGMGKSVCGDLLRARGLPAIDTDDLARELVAPGKPAFQEVVQAFGPGILDPACGLDRQRLARLVFGNESDRKRLEAILHPRIRECWIQQVSQWKAQGHKLGAVIIPLLFETGAQQDLDATLCVACSEGTQKNRLRERGWSAEHIQRRLSAQWPAARKMELSSFVIWSEGSLQLHRDQLERIVSGFAG